MVRLKNLFLILFFFGYIPSNLSAQAFDILHADYRIRLLPEQKNVEGTAVYTVRLPAAVTEITLDADERVAIKQVRTGKRNLKFHHDGNRLLIRLPKGKKTRKIEIDFKTVNPKQALYFVGWDNENKNQVWTQGQGKKHSHWMPVVDDVNERFTWQLDIRFPAGYEVVSNGKLTEKHTDSTATEWQYVYVLNKPAPSYLLFIGAGKYTIGRDTINGIPYEACAYPDARQPDMTFSKSAEIFRTMEKLIGFPFPWEQYREVPLRDFIYGGMENVTASVFSDFYVVNDTAWNDVNPVNVLAHELAHQWFGNYVTETSPVHHWLHESFATFYAWETEKALFGKDYTDFQYYNYLQAIIEAYRKGDTVPLLNGKASSLTFYQKGAWLIRMMRDRLGQENFDKVIKHFLQNHPYQNVTTSDFKKSLFAVTGDSLDGFFKRYFETAAIPSYTVRRSHDTIYVESSDGEPLSVRIYYVTGKFEDVKVKDFYKIPGSKSYAFYLPDPERRTLADLNWQPDENELLYALRAPLSDLDTYRILLRFETVSLDKKYSLLSDMAAWDYYYPVHAEILYQIKDAPDSMIVPVLRKILKHGLKNRQAVSHTIRHIPPALRTDYESLLDDPSYVTIGNALWNLWQAFPERRHFYLDKTKGKTGLNDRELRMLWLLMAISDSTYAPEAERTGYVEELIAYASPAYNVETRMTALDFLDMLGLINEHTYPFIKQAAEYFHPQLRRKAREILKKHGLPLPGN